MVIDSSSGMATAASMKALSRKRMLRNFTVVFPFQQ